MGWSAPTFRRSHPALGLSTCGREERIPPCLSAACFQISCFRREATRVAKTVDEPQIDEALGVEPGHGHDEERARSDVRLGIIPCEPPQALRHEFRPVRTLFCAKD